MLTLLALLAANAGAVPAIPAATFLASLGANSAISRRGEDLAHTAACVKYLGLRWIRCGYEGGVPVEDLLELHRLTGVKFSYGLLSGGSDIPRLLDGARKLAAAGALVAIEGNNEPNNWGVTYQGEKGGRDGSWLAVARLQHDLYEAVKADPVLHDIPVWSCSENGAQTDNVGLQFLTIPEGAGALMPDGTTYADYANCHNYMLHPSWPGLHDNQTWIASDPSPACRVDGLYGNYGRTWRNKFPGYPEDELAGLPKVTTETGTTIHGPFTEEVQARLYMSVYLAQLKRGWSYTSIYLLRDRSDEAGNQTFGFYQTDYSPRLAATFLHNLTTILADDQAIAAPGSLAYTIPNQPDTVHDLLLQKADGTLALVVWDERYAGGTDEVTVQLGVAAETVKVYDPTVGVEPVQTLQQPRSVSLTMSDHPIVIELKAGG